MQTPQGLTAYAGRPPRGAARPDSGRSRSHHDEMPGNDPNGCIGADDQPPCNAALDCVPNHFAPPTRFSRPFTGTKHLAHTAIKPPCAFFTTCKYPCRADTGQRFQNAELMPSPCQSQRQARNRMNRNIRHQNHQCAQAAIHRGSCRGLFLAPP